jgi:hypothetical protein
MGGDKKLGLLGENNGESVGSGERGFNKDSDSRALLRSSMLPQVVA